MVFRTRELLIRQRTQAIDALRGDLGEFGQIVPQGAANAARLITLVEDPDSGLPADAIATLKVPVGALTHPETEIGKVDAEIARRARKNEVAQRLMTVPGIGPLIATAIAVLARSCRGVGGNSKAASSPDCLKPTRPAATAREVRAFLPPVRRNARTREPDC
jgi:transposase